MIFKSNSGSSNRGQTPENSSNSDQSSGSNGGNEPQNATPTEPTCTTTIYYLDSDGDGFGDPNNSTTTCQMLEGYVENNLDCDDSNKEINPNATEICDDGIDNNCNGKKDSEEEICQQKCDQNHLNLCSNESDCTNAGGTWDASSTICSL